MDMNQPAKGTIMRKKIQKGDYRIFRNLALYPSLHGKMVKILGGKFGELYSVEFLDGNRMGARESELSQY